MEKLSWLEKMSCAVLRSGLRPQHIAFIMDGNRRHAKKNNMKSVLNGHELGVQALKKTLLLCKQLEIKMISLFCFSIENFNRSKEEVDGLMALCISTFHQMSEMSEILLREQIKVNIVGKTELLREDVREALNSISEKTIGFDKMEINLCFAYDGLYEAQESLGNMNESQGYGDFLKNLSISQPVDILVRTGDENRLSNFMLAQCEFAYICFLKENWPEIGLLSFAKILLEYNYHAKDILESSKRFFTRQNSLKRTTQDSN